MGQVSSWPARCHGAVAVRAHFALLATALAAALCTTTLHAQTNTLSGTVALGSQLVDRGMALTPVTPILQGALTWTSAGGWIVGLQAATVLRSPGQDEALVQLGHYWSLSEDWRMLADATYYDYPGNAQASAYARTEAGVSWMYRDVLTLGLSAIRLTSSNDHTVRGAADFDFHWPLPWQLSFAAGAGVTQSLVRGGPHAYEYGYAPGSPYYGYGHAGLIWAHGPWRVELDRIATTMTIGRHVDGLTAAPWVATLSWSF